MDLQAKSSLEENKEYHEMLLHSLGENTDDGDDNNNNKCYCLEYSFCAAENVVSDDQNNLKNWDWQAESLKYWHLACSFQSDASASKTVRFHF